MNQKNSDGIVDSILNRIDLSKRESIQYGLNILSFFGFLLSLYLVYWGFTAGIFTSEVSLQNFLDYLGPAAPYGFILIQIVQVVVPIVPGSITIAFGTMVFGVGYGFLLNLIGIMIGSVINFALARRYGQPLVALLLGEKQLNKYMGWLNKNNRFDRLFTFGMFFPISPDDTLCYLSGLSTMTFKKFFLILSMAKPISLFIYSYGLFEIINYILQLIG